MSQHTTLFVIVTFIASVFGSGKLKIINVTDSIENGTINVRPLIGILSQQVKPTFQPKINRSSSYIAASYVKWVESAGAQAVPILSTYTNEHVMLLMHRINGVIIPGGGRSLYDSNYARVARIIIKETERLNKGGVHFPIWGTCLGFQALMVIVSGKKQRILGWYDGKKIMRPIHFTDEAFKSRMFSKINMPLMKAMRFRNLSIHMHQRGMSPKKFEKLENLTNFFKVLGVSEDKTGRKFVSLLEGKKYPIYGSQFHPEKNPFEWTKSVDFNHEPMAIEASQYLGNFFVNEARKNNQQFHNFKEEEKHLMAQYAPVYSGGFLAFQQVYAFGRHTETYIH